MHSYQSMVASVQRVASASRRDTYLSSTTALVPLRCLAPNSSRRARGFVQLDVCTASTVPSALLPSTSPRKRLLVIPIDCLLRSKGQDDERL